MSTNSEMIHSKTLTPTIWTSVVSDYIWRVDTVGQPWNEVVVHRGPQSMEYTHRHRDKYADSNSSSYSECCLAVVIRGEQAWILQCAVY